jgi:serine/threonine-protein kinase
VRFLFLHRLRYGLLRWGGPADATPTEFASTVFSAEWPEPGDAQRGRQPPAAPARQAPLPPPMVCSVGHYVIKGRLGAGRLGEVFDAWDPMLSRAVAVKTLRLQLEPGLRALLDDQLLQEARAVAGLRHPHIVPVFDAGLYTQGVYIAMPRLHGRDLRQALATGWRPSPEHAAQLARRVAEALAYAHGKGVVHCDIKPANIFLDQDDRPLVLDFGIARMAHDHHLPGIDGPLLDSPQYLAPEQLKQGAADPRTDIRALGAVLYEMLTGRKAFDGGTVGQVMRAVLLDEAMPAHEVEAGVPRALSAIAAKAMARDPERRHASAAELARELREWGERPLDPAPVPAARKARQTRPPAAAARRRIGAAWTLATAMLCVATAGWLWWVSAPAPAPRLGHGTAPGATPMAAATQLPVGPVAASSGLNRGAGIMAADARSSLS